MLPAFPPFAHCDLEEFVDGAVCAFCKIEVLRIMELRSDTTPLPLAIAVIGVIDNVKVFHEVLVGSGSGQQ
jgi:hypothetical protein